MPFEDPFGTFFVGTITATVLDPSGNPPSTIIKTTDAWAIQVDWSAGGPVAGVMGGTWHVKVFVESIGGGFEGPVGSADVAVGSVPPAPLPRNYTTSVLVPAGTVPAGPLKVRAYKVVSLLTYDNLGVTWELAAYHEGPIIQIYEP